MNIFKANGQIDTGIDPQTIPADRRGAFVALVTAQAAAEQAELNEKATDQNVAECVRVHDAALTRIPKQTITSLVKETFGLV
jgi:hypothetical protein